MIVEMDCCGFKDLVLLNKDKIFVFAKTTPDEIILYTNIGGVEIVCKSSTDLLTEVEEFIQQNGIVKVKNILHGYQL